MIRWKGDEIIDLDAEAGSDFALHQGPGAETRDMPHRPPEGVRQRPEEMAAATKQIACWSRLKRTNRWVFTLD